MLKWNFLYLKLCIRREEIMNVAAFICALAALEHRSVPSSHATTLAEDWITFFRCNLSILEIKTLGRV